MSLHDSPSKLSLAIIFGCVPALYLSFLALPLLAAGVAGTLSDGFPQANGLVYLLLVWPTGGLLGTLSMLLVTCKEGTRSIHGVVVHTAMICFGVSSSIFLLYWNYATSQVLSLTSLLAASTCLVAAPFLTWMWQDCLNSQLRLFE